MPDVRRTNRGGLFLGSAQRCSCRPSNVRKAHELVARTSVLGDHRRSPTQFAPMMNPYSPSQELVASAVATPQLRASATLALTVFSLLNLCVGMVLGLYFCAMILEGPGVALRRLAHALANPVFVVIGATVCFMLLAAWKVSRRRKRADYTTTVFSRLVAGFVFVCVFYLAGNLIDEPIRATAGIMSAGGFTQLLPLPIALLMAMIGAVEFEAIWIHSFSRSDQVGGEP